MAKMMVFIAEQNKKKLVEISTSPRGLGIYIRLFNKEVVKT